MPPDEGGGRGGSWEKEGKGGGFLRDEFGGRLVTVAAGAALGTVGGGGRVFEELAGRKLVADVAGIAVGTVGRGVFVAEEVGKVFRNNGGKTEGEATGITAFAPWLAFPIPAGASGGCASLSTTFGFPSPAVMVISRILPFELMALLVVSVAIGNC